MELTATSNDDLQPWRDLYREDPRGDRYTRLRKAVLAQVTGMDPLALPASGKVVIAGDWHGDTTHAIGVVENAADEGIDLILQVGDFGFWPGFEGEQYLDQLNAACAQEGVTLVWVDGNHEDHDRLSRYPIAPCGLRPVRPHIWHVPRGHRWTWHGRVWCAVGGAVSVDRGRRREGISWWPGEVLSLAEAASVAAAGPADVLLLHDRPTMVAAARGQTPGSWHRAAPPIWDRRDLIASDTHAALLQTVCDALRPSRLFHGHLHERYDLTVNPAPWGGGCRVSALADQTDPYGNVITVRLDQP